MYMCKKTWALSINYFHNIDKIRWRHSYKKIL